MACSQSAVSDAHGPVAGPYQQRSQEDDDCAAEAEDEGVSEGDTESRSRCDLVGGGKRIDRFRGVSEARDDLKSIPLS